MKYDYEERLVEFAANCAKFSKSLFEDRVGNYYANQLLRSAGSSALNYGEAQGTNTTSDFIHKVSLVLKELKESRVILKILTRLELGSISIRESLLKESEELIAISATMIKNRKLKS